MQTIKTAAIVVLMMTVMYSAYISLTTPPEPLPDDVRDLVINDQGTLSISGELPDSLDALGINDGTPSNAALSNSARNASAEAEAETFGSLELPASIGSSPQNPTFQNAASQNTAPLSDTGFAAGDATDLPPATNVSLDAAVGLPAAAADLPGESGVTTRLTDMDPNPNGSLNVPEAGGVAKQTAPNYPTTNRTFNIPDPNQVASSFGRNNETLDIPQTDLVPTDLALAGGNPDSSMKNAQAISQTSALGTQDSNMQNEIASPTQSLGPNTGLANALRLADKQYSADKPEEALATLSIFYNTPNLSGEERAELLSRLDPLARDVIYSQRHLLEQPHRVGQNETLMEIAARYEVPWQLLANINQVQDPVTILPGTELKVVRGPFRAEVNLSMNELTLFLGDHYAGRFPIGVGTEPAPKPGTFTVQDKQTERTYYNRAGSPIPPGTPGNPYGNIWLGLGGQLCIHGSPSASSPTDKGCISLAADFADDLYGILSQGSSVTIRR